MKREIIMKLKEAKTLVERCGGSMIIFDRITRWDTDHRHLRLEYLWN